MRFRAGGKDIGWLDTLYEEIPRLRGNGWEIRIAPDFPYDLVDTDGSLDIEVREGSGIDWFELDLGVMVNGKRINLVGPLVDLIASETFDPALFATEGSVDGPIYLPLPDGRIIALPAAKLVPIIVHLDELFAALGHTSESRLPRFSLLDTASLARLEVATVEAVLAGAAASVFVRSAAHYVTMTAFRLSNCHLR